MGKRIKIRYDELGTLDLIVSRSEQTGLSGVYEEIDGMRVFRDARTGTIAAFGFLNFPASYEATVQALYSRPDWGRYDLPEAGIQDGELAEILDWAYQEYIVNAASKVPCARCGQLLTPVIANIDLLDRALTIHSLELYRCPVCGYEELTESGQVRLATLIDRLREVIPVLPGAHDRPVAYPQPKLAGQALREK